jgi:hypothetical protein
MTGAESMLRNELARLTRERDEARAQWEGVSEALTDAEKLVRVYGTPISLTEGILCALKERDEAREWAAVTARQADEALAERDRLKAVLLKIGARLADIQDEILTALKEQP